MKKHKIFLLIALLASSLLLALSGCKMDLFGFGDDDDGTVSGSSSESSMARLTIGVSGNSSARTIMPAAVTDGSNYGYKLTGTSSRGTTVEQVLDFSSDSTVSVSLAKTYWELKLTAYTDSACTAGKEVFAGSAAVDLSTGDTSVTFTLSPEGVSGNGTVSLTINYPTNAGVTKYTAGIYELNNSSFGTLTAVQNSSGSDMKTSGDTSSGSFTFSQTGAPSGTYLFAVTLSSATEEIVFYSDVIVIYANRETTGMITINSDLIGTAPTAPATFTASLVNSSASQTDNDSYYNVVFNWTDSSDNEKYFRLVITDLDNSNATESYPIASSSNTDERATSDRVTSLVSGSFLPSTTSATLRLPTGRRFEAKIQAVGSKLDSTETARTAGTSDTDSTPFAADSTINLVRRVYNLDGGTLKLGTDEYSNVYYQFQTFTGTDIALIAVDGTTNTLTKTSSTFKHWQDTATGAEATAPSGCADGSYKAIYDGGFSISYELSQTAELDSSEVVATDGTASIINTSCDVSTAKNITLSVTGTYSSYEFRRYSSSTAYTTLYSGTNSSCSFSSTDVDSAPYGFLVIVKETNGSTRSATFYTKFTR